HTAIDRVHHHWFRLGQLFHPHPVDGAHLAYDWNYRHLDLHRKRKERQNRFRIKNPGRDQLPRPAHFLEKCTRRDPSFFKMMNGMAAPSLYPKLDHRSVCFLYEPLWHKHQNRHPIAVKRLAKWIGRHWHFSDRRQSCYSVDIVYRLPAQRPLCEVSVRSNQPLQTVFHYQDGGQYSVGTDAYQRVHPVNLRGLLKKHPSLSINWLHQQLFGHGDSLDRFPSIYSNQTDPSYALK